MPTSKRWKNTSRCGTSIASFWKNSGEYNLYSRDDMYDAKLRRSVLTLALAAKG